MASEWNSETGYHKTLAIDASTISIIYPYRVHSAGARGGLNVLLRSFDTDFDYMCRGSATGFKVILHAPNELPHTMKHYLIVPNSVETQITVTPDVSTISNDLSAYNWKRYNRHTQFGMLYTIFIFILNHFFAISRKCYLKGERSLEFFKDYTQANCELECTSNFIIKRCGCAKFSMPSNTFYFIP